MKVIVKLVPILLAVSVLSACKTTRQVAMNDPIKPDPAEIAKRRIETAKINAQLGMAYLEHKNLKRAKQKLLAALKQGPNIPEPWYSMGYFQEATGNRIAAREYYEKAVQVAPDRGDAHNNYGTYLCRGGEYQQSIKHFVIAARSTDYLDPAAAYENAGVCSMKMKKFKQAARFLDKALLEDPSRTSSMVKLARVQYKLGQFKRAKQTMVKYSMLAEPTAESRAFNTLLNKKSRVS